MLLSELLLFFVRFIIVLFLIHILAGIRKDQHFRKNLLFLRVIEKLENFKINTVNKKIDFSKRKYIFKNYEIDKQINF